jgi:hypothetical protein
VREKPPSGDYSLAWRLRPRKGDCAIFARHFLQFAPAANKSQSPPSLGGSCVLRQLKEIVDAAPERSSQPQRENGGRHEDVILHRGDRLA